MSLQDEIKKLNELTAELQKLNSQKIKREDVLRLLEFLKDLIPLLIKTFRAR